MRLNEQDLHGKTTDEAIRMVGATVDFMIKHNEPGIVFIHGKGIHSNWRAVVKQEV